jgi:lysozyme
MRTSDDGLNAIIKREGCELTAYPDPATGGEPWTIGVGHTGGVKEGDTCTEERAKMWLSVDLQTAEKCINNSVRVAITQSQLDALVSFVFNVGCGNFRQSTLLRMLNDGDDQGAADQFLVWNKAGGKIMQGIINRRESERAQFLS